MTESTDFIGIAALVGAVTVSITSVGGFVLTALTFVRQRERDAKVEIIHTLVNSQSEKLNAAIKTGALAEGFKAGVESKLVPDKK